MRFMASAAAAAGAVRTCGNKKMKCLPSLYFAPRALFDIPSIDIIFLSTVKKKEEGRGTVRFHFLRWQKHSKKVPLQSPQGKEITRTLRNVKGGRKIALPDSLPPCCSMVDVGREKGLLAFSPSHVCSVQPPLSSRSPEHLVAIWRSCSANSSSSSSSSKKISVFRTSSSPLLFRTGGRRRGWWW